MKNIQRIVCAVLSLLMAVLLPAASFAQVYDIAYGDITVNAKADGKQYVSQPSNSISEEEQTSETVIGGTSDSYSLTIHAEAGAEADVTLDNLNIDVSKIGKKAAVSSEGDGDVTIELDNTNTLKSGQDRAGLEKNEAGSLTIGDDNGTAGSLNAKGGGNGAGIGAGFPHESADITITGGTITAEGDFYASGIGSSAWGMGYDITIAGGTVTAIGGECGSGIGSFNITITGGTVTAQGNGGGAGIGSTNSYDTHDITITGGTVTAIGSGCSAGIGSSQGGNAKDITITGDAQVRAQGSASGRYGTGAAIGSGGQRNHVTDETFDGEEIELDTAELTATGKIEYYAPGADMSTDAPSKTITGTHTHIWDSGNETTPATCSKKGVMTYTCTAGNDFTKTEEIPINPDAHTVVTDKAVAPTYTSTGLTEGSHCSGCGKVFKKQEVVPALALYRVLDADGKDIAYTAEQQDGVLTVTVDADFAVFSAEYDALRILKDHQGVEKIVFAAAGTLSAFAPADAMEKGGRGDVYDLTHNGDAVTFVLREKNTDVSDILEKA